MKNPNKSAALFVLVVLVISSGACQRESATTSDGPATRPSAEAIAEADALYAGRTDLNKVRQGVISLRRAQASDQSNYEVAWRLAKLNYFLGAHTTEPTEQEKAFRDGVDAGKLAVKIEENKPEGHFWLGANYGGSAQLSVLTGLSQIEDIKNEMDRVLKIDEKYQSGSAYMVLGQVYLQSPRLLGGDATKAIEYLEKGLKFGPNNSLLHLRLAEAYAEAHRDDEARKQIEELRAIKFLPEYEAEHNEALEGARKLEEKLKR